MGTKSVRRTPEEALRVSVEALGGLQQVGHSFKPETHPELAGQWLAHCLTASKRDKLSLQQVAHIFREAQVRGEHEGFAMFAALCGYEAKPVLPEALLVDAFRRAELAQREAEETRKDLQTLIENPRLLATLKAAHVNVEALG